MALVTSITLTGILIYIGLVLFAFLLLLKQKKIDFNTDLSLIIKAFLIYIFAFTVSKFINSGCNESCKVLLKTFQDLFIFLWAYLFVLKNDKNNKLFKCGLFLAIFITIGYGISQFFHMDIFHRQQNINRISGFHKNTYSYAGQLIVFFFFLLLEAKKNTNKLLKITLLGLTFFCILNSSERAVILGVLVGIVVYFFLTNTKKEDLAKIIFVISLPLLVTKIFHSYVLKRINNTFTSSRGIRGNIRFKIWKSAIAVWKKNLLFGAGKFPVFIYKPAAGFKIQYLTHAHNIYLQILVANGLLGLVAFLNLFYTFIIVLLRHMKESRFALCLLLIIVAFSIEGIFEFFYGDSEVRYLLLFFSGYTFGNLIIPDQSTKN